MELKLNRIMILPSVILVMWSFSRIASRTENDERRLYEAGQPKVIQGILDGNFVLFREGLAGGGSLNEVMEPFLGELILKLGKPYEDFPICPPLHFAINLGSYQQLSIAEFIIRNGIDTNQYQLPPPPPQYDPWNRGYPPAILYGFGFGQRPTETHAGLIQRLHLTHSNYFNLTSTVPLFLNQTGNSPLIHICASIGNVQGILLLISQFNFSVNMVERVHHLTPLHIAAWFGDVDSMILLLHNGGDVMAEDRFHRLPFHYSLIRQHLTIATILLNYHLESNQEDYSKAELFKQFLFHQDKLGRDAFDYLLSAPYNLGMISLFQKISKEVLGVSIETMLLDNSTYHEVSNKELRFRKWNELISFLQQEARQKREANNVSVCSYLPDEDEDEPKTEKNKSNSMRSLMTIDKVAAGKNFTRLYFSRHYYSMQRPVLIVNQLALGFGIWAYIGNQLDFLDRYGNLRIHYNEQIYDRYYHHLCCYPPYLASKHGPADEYEKKCFPTVYGNDGDDEPTEVAVLTINDFVLQARAEDFTTVGATSSGSSSGDSTHPSVSSSSSSMKIAQATIADKHYKQNWFTDFHRPSLFDLCGEKDHEQYKITLSSHNTMSALHYHNATWNLLLKGRKIWYLLPPATLTNQSLFDEIHQETSITKSELFSSTSFLKRSQLQQILPILQRNYFFYEVLQQPEEILFLPDLWGHIVLSLEDSICLSQEFCTFLNTDMRIQPLGHVLYGGKDEFRGYGSFKTHRRTQKKSKFKIKTEKYKIPNFDKSIIT